MIPQGRIYVVFARQGRISKVLGPAGLDFSGSCPRGAGFFVHGRAWPETYNQQNIAGFTPIRFTVEGGDQSGLADPPTRQTSADTRGFADPRPTPPPTVLQHSVLPRW